MLRPVALFAFYLAVLPASPAVLISSCETVISQPGQYHLSSDIVCGTSETGITITADHVELHLDGHTLSGNGTSLFGVDVTGSDVRILGSGEITGFIAGISLFKNRDNRIENVTAINNPTGILLLRTSANT